MLPKSRLIAGLAVGLALGSVMACATEKVAPQRAPAVVAKEVPCAPPSDEEVRRVAATLTDFPALFVEEGVLKARALTDGERGDLAYFLVAVDEGRPVAVVDDPGDWEHPGPPNPERDRLLRREKEAAARGDVKAEIESARAYLMTLGYPGPIRGREEHNYGWAAPAWVTVWQDLAAADERVGNFEEAAELYRRGSLGSAACGTGAEFAEQDRLRGEVRSWEQVGRCRAAVAVRMLLQGAFDGADVYGTARLQRSGFDVERLYRGALVTVNHGAPQAVVEKAISSANLANGPAMRARLLSRGEEDWDTRTRALEGWAERVGERSLPELVRLAKDAVEPVRLRAIQALGQLGGGNEAANCDPSGCGDEHFSGSIVGGTWRRELHALASSCDTALSQEKRASLAAAMAPLLKDPVWTVRSAAADALGEIGDAESLEPLRGAAEDPAIDGMRCEAAGHPCNTPIYPVRESVQAAIPRIEKRAQAERQRALCQRVRLPALGVALKPRSSDPRLVGTPVEGLLDPVKQDATYRALVEAGHLRPGAFVPSLPESADKKVGQVLLAPQDDGPSRVVVFDEGPLNGVERPKGGFAVLDSEGYFLPIFSNANFVDDDAKVFNFAGEQLGVAFTLRLGLHDRETLSVLIVLPFANPSTPILGVVLAHSRDEFRATDGDSWTYRVVPDGPERPPRIEVGTYSALAKDAPEAIYRWSVKGKRYDGPDGQIGGGFFRLPPDVFPALFSYLAARY